jgi:hypothetical protein
MDWRKVARKRDGSFDYSEFLTHFRYCSAEEAVDIARLAAKSGNLPLLKATRIIEKFPTTDLDVAIYLHSKNVKLVNTKFPIVDACNDNNYERVVSRIFAYDNVNCVGTYTPLRYAILNNNYDIVELLKACGALC